MGLFSARKWTCDKCGKRHRKNPSKCKKCGHSVLTKRTKD